jgi:hypothetical protein
MKYIRNVSNGLRSTAVTNGKHNDSPAIAANVSIDPVTMLQRLKVHVCTTKCHMFDNSYIMIVSFSTNK